MKQSLSGSAVIDPEQEPVDGAQISLIIPVHNEADALPALFREVNAALQDLDFEVLVVNDGSSDGTAKVLDELAAADRRWRVVDLGTNRGQSAAILAGLKRSGGEIVAMMDGDGQNDPADLPGMIERFNTGPAVDAVIGVRQQRQDSRWKKLQSRVANRVRDMITRDRVTDTGCSLRAVKRRYIVDLPDFDGVHRFVPTFVRARGATIMEVPVHHRPRRYGRSHYGARGRAVKGLKDAFRVRRMLRQMGNAEDR